MTFQGNRESIDVAIVSSKQKCLDSILDHTYAVKLS